MLCEKSLLMGFGLGMFVIYLIKEEPQVICEDNKCKPHMLEGKKCECPSLE